MPQRAIDEVLSSPLLHQEPLHAVLQQQQLRSSTSQQRDIKQRAKMETLGYGHMPRNAEGNLSEIGAQKSCATRHQNGGFTPEGMRSLTLCGERAPFARTRPHSVCHERAKCYGSSIDRGAAQRTNNVIPV